MSEPPPTTLPPGVIKFVAFVAFVVFVQDKTPEPSVVRTWLVVPSSAGNVSV